MKKRTKIFICILIIILLIVPSFLIFEYFSTVVPIKSTLKKTELNSEELMISLQKRVESGEAKLELLNIDGEGNYIYRLLLLENGESYCITICENKLKAEDEFDSLCRMFNLFGINLKRDISKNEKTLKINYNIETDINHLGILRKCVIQVDNFIIYATQADYILIPTSKLDKYIKEILL